MIYHYTDLNAAISIANNAQMWLTDYRFLNDKKEFNEGFDVLLEALEAYHDYSGKYCPEFLDTLSRAVEFIRDDNFSNLERNNIFVSSFSKTPDLLSQWRSYGMYCLELDADFFRDDEVSVLECVYLHDRREALDKADLIICDEFIPVLFDIWKENRPYLIDLKLSSLLEIHALSFKHAAFVDEDEVRFVLSCAPDDARIKFRGKGQLLIPYVSFDFDPELLKTITIGPVDNQDLAYESLSMFARKIKRKVQESNIEYDLVIEKSEVPFRSI
ncbi:MULTISPECIES: hypothetical protein [Citrobacter]|uniref:hypothetical protein n=1 Tax=Citrobacter TaxID=544 RepID=UPI00351CD055